MRNYHKVRNKQLNTKLKKTFFWIICRFPAELLFYCISSTETLIHFAPEKGHVSEIITFSNASPWEHSLVLKTDTELRKKNHILVRHSEVLMSASGILCTKVTWQVLCYEPVYLLALTSFVFLLSCAVTYIIVLQQVNGT